MWSDNSTTYGFCSNSHCMCHTSMVPCLGTSPPVTQYWYNNIVPLSSSTFPKYQSPPDNTTYGFSHVSNPVNPPLFHVGKQEAAGDHQQMATNETDSWLPPNLYNNKVDGSMNLASYCSLTGNQNHGQFDQMLLNYNGQSSKEQLNFSQNDYSTSPSIFYPGASLQSTSAGIIPEATIGITNLPREWAHNQLEFSPVNPGNLVQEAVGSHSSSTRTTSLGTQQLVSKDDLKGSLSRQERILRYFEKKKSRKYEKKIIYSSRKTYARTRPRIRGRFARSSQN